MSTVHPLVHVPVPDDDVGPSEQKRTTRLDAPSDDASEQRDRSPLVGLQARVRGKLARKEWNHVRLLHKGSVAWKKSQEDARVWVVRPKLILDLLQHDHFQKAGIFWLLLYLLFIVLFVATAVKGQRANLYYELEVGLEQRLGQAAGGIDSVHSVSQVWDFLDGLVAILHEDEDPTMNRTAGQRLDSDWSYWAQFKVDSPAAESGTADTTQHRLIALQNRVIGSGMLIAQRRRQVSSSCDEYGTVTEPTGSSNSGMCLSHSESTVTFAGRHSGAQYNWVPQCNCYPAGVFGVKGTGTTLSQDRHRLRQLQNDGWVDARTSELKASVLLHNPTRRQLGVVTVQFNFVDSGWVTGGLSAESTPVWRPFSEMAFLSISTMCLWAVHAGAELHYACRIGMKS